MIKKTWMQYSVVLIALAVLVLVAGTSPAVAASRASRVSDPENYVAIKAGVFTPTGDLEDWDSGAYGEIAFGHYFNPNLALEAALAATYFESPSGNSSAEMYPFTVNAKGIIPINDKVELYGMFGLGLYQVYGESTYDYSDLVLGYDLGVGAKFKIDRSIALGLEWKYLHTGEVGDSGIEVEGSVLTGGVYLNF